MDTSDRQQKPARGLKLSLDYVETHEGTGRLEAFSDGIFAIAATLLVTDIRVPPGLSDPARLWQALASLWPNYLGYALSFLYIGVYWSHHYHVFRLFKRTDHIFFKINVLFLMTISFLPFSTALLAEYLREPGGTQRIAILFYTGSLFVTATLFFSIWLYAIYRRRLVDQDLDQATIRENTRQYGFAPIGYALAFLSSFWNPWVSLAIAIIVSAYYSIPLQAIRTD